MKNFIQVITTTDKREEADKIARHLVEEKLAACVQILDGIESTYLWKGKIETSREYLCLIKTRENLYPQVETAIKKMHAYETPEILAVPIVKGSKDYLQWLDQSLAENPGK